MAFREDALEFLPSGTTRRLAREMIVDSEWDEPHVVSPLRLNASYSSTKGGEGRNPACGSQVGLPAAHLFVPPPHIFLAILRRRSLIY